MIKTKLGLLFLFLFLFSAGEGQILRINNECNPLVSSLQDIVYIVRQEYALKGPDGELYGQNNQEYFGFRYGVALLWNEQLYMSPVTYYAYQRDTVASTYGAGYVGVPSSSYFRHIDAPVFTKINPEALTANPERVLATMEDSLSGMQDTGTSEGFKSKTILITIECKDEVPSDTSQYKLNFLYTDLITEPNGSIHIKGNTLGSHVQFALIFEEITEVGSAKLEFLGFAETINNEVKVNLVKVDQIDHQKKKGKGNKK
ncbi:MAG: hypothetical protein GC180_03795 [Bacteroidetes bacterium]|nr:hypothetical protein [Bacteroidota bacterium]